MKLSNNVAHMIIQCVPVDVPKISGFVQQFEKGVKAHSLDFFRVAQEENIKTYIHSSEFYFYLECYNNLLNAFDRYLYVFKDHAKFPYDFGRQILCEIYDVKRTNWKDCKLTAGEIQEQIGLLKKNLNVK